MIFYFDRNFGSKDRERLESFEVEAEDYEAAVQTIIKTQSQNKFERRGNNLFFSWKGEGGKDCFDYFPSLTPQPQEPTIEESEQPTKEQEQ